ncbi:MAG: hypothetical protein HY592_02425 [Candidatus Omnitrophica bacterium]|nr:hypothetical protein [Candidatus Omnitrophota bacterium]
MSIEKKADALGLKKSLEEALAARKSIMFEIVNSREQAELFIESRIKGFLYQDNDPIDMIGGLGMAAMDAARNQHYVRLEADIIVTDLKSGQPLWEDSLAATLTADDITPENSPAKINDRLAKLFIRQAFGKSR